MPVSNEEFIKKAFESGLTEEQVRGAVAERNQKKAVQTEPKTRTKSTEPEASGWSKVKGAVSKFSKIGKTIASAGGGLDLKMGTGSVDRGNVADFAKATELTNQAKQTDDLEQKRMLLAEARSIMEGSGERTEKLRQKVKNVRTSANITDKDMQMSNLEFATRTGGGAALEAGSLMSGGVGATGAKTVMGRIGQQAAKGALGGALGGAVSATDEETLGGAAKDIAVGAASGAVLSALFAGGGEAVKKGRKKVSETLIEQSRDRLDAAYKSNKSLESKIKQHGGLEEMKKIASREKIETKSTKKLAKQFKDYQPEFEKEVNGILAKNKNKGMDFNKVLKDSIADIKRTHGGAEKEKTEAMIAFLENNYRDTQRVMTPDGMNRLRKGVDAATGGKALGDIAADKALAQKFVANNLRKEMASKVPALQAPMDKYGTMTTMLEIMKPDKFVDLLRPFTSPFAVVSLAAGGGGAYATNVGSNIVGAKSGTPQAQRGLASGMSKAGARLGNIKPSTGGGGSILPAMIGRTSTASRQDQ